MAKQEVTKIYRNVDIDAEEMLIYEYDVDGDLVGTHCLYELLDELAKCDSMDLTISYTSEIHPIEMDGVEYE